MWATGLPLSFFEKSEQAATQGSNGDAFDTGLAGRWDDHQRWSAAAIDGSLVRGMHDDSILNRCDGVLSLWHVAAIGVSISAQLASVAFGGLIVVVVRLADISTTHVA